MKRRLNRAHPSYTTRAFYSVIDTGLSMVYPVRSDAADDDGWLFTAGYPPSYEALGRIRSALIFRLCRSLSGKRALDVAAGGCGLSASLTTAGSNVVVNDLRTEVLESIALYDVDERRVTTVGGNVFDLEPAILGVFDLIVATEVIEHVAHPDRLLAHLSRFLAPGGRIVVTTPNGLFFRNELPTLQQIEDPDALESKQFQPDADGHLFLLTPGELHSLVNEAGLAVESMFVWGTPLLTGHAGLHRFAGRWMTPIARSMEWIAQRLPESIRGRICYSLVATLARPSS